MSRILRISALLLLSSLSSTSFADEVFSWKKCVELAMQNNNNLKSAIANEKSYEYQKDASISGFLPQASASLSSNRGNSGNASNPAITSVQSSVTEAYSGSVSVTQNVFSGFQDVGKFTQASANRTIAKANVNIVKAQVSYDLKSSYASLTYAKETVNLLDDIIRRREDNLRIIELRFQSGMENKGSLLLARAYLEQAKYDRLQATNLIESAKAQLCRAIGLNECAAYDIKDAIPIKENAGAKINFASIIQSTPQHQQAVAQEKAAKAGITIAQSTFFPTLNVSASAGQRGTTLFPQNDYWSTTVNLTFPFFTGGKDYYTMQSAYSQSSAARENRENTDQQILVNLKQTHNSYIESAAKLKVDKSFQDAARMRADIARAKYNNGLLLFENWDVIETDLINRQKSYLQSKRDRVISEAAFEQSQGKGVFYND